MYGSEGGFTISICIRVRVYTHCMGYSTYCPGVRVCECGMPLANFPFTFLSLYFGFAFSISLFSSVQLLFFFLFFFLIFTIAISVVLLSVCVCVSVSVCDIIIITSSFWLPGLFNLFMRLPSPKRIPYPY